jgi:hypothetical protein
MRWGMHVTKDLVWSAFCWCRVLSGFLAMPAAAQKTAGQSNMELVGYNDFQGRNAYIPGHLKIRRPCSKSVNSLKSLVPIT